MEIDQAVTALAALAHPMRLQVFRALVVAGPEGLNPGPLAEQLGLPPATLSFHLKELNSAGLTAAERDGRFLIYRAQYPQMDALMGFLTENCCAGKPCTPRSKGACR
jgi:DNA-binding transcriptional ArsR family regulator